MRDVHDLISGDIITIESEPSKPADRQGADSEKRPAEVRRRGSEPHFWEISEPSQAILLMPKKKTAFSRAFKI
jgi:hypothetical protein